MVVSHAGDGTVYNLKPDVPDNEIVLLKAVRSKARPDMIRCCPWIIGGTKRIFCSQFRTSPTINSYRPTERRSCPAMKTFLAEAVLRFQAEQHPARVRTRTVVPGQPFYVSDENAEKTYETTVSDDGTLTNLKLFAEQGGESVAVDEKGNVYVAAGQVYVLRSVRKADRYNFGP
jgi:hypothetical protein